MREHLCSSLTSLTLRQLRDISSCTGYRPREEIHLFWIRIEATTEKYRERLDISNAHARQKKEMNDVLSAMYQQFRDEEVELNQEFEAQREEIKNRNSEEYNVLKIQLEGMT